MWIKCSRPSKALIIYRKCIEIAWTKDVTLELNFDDILKDNDEYNSLKKAHLICSTLKEMQDINDTPDADQLIEFTVFAKENNIGLMRFFILYYCGLLLGKIDEKRLQCKVLFEALDFLKWLKRSEIIGLYEDCLKAVLIPAYRLSEYEKLIHYSNLILEYC